MSRAPRWFRALLRALPADFREAHEEEIVELAAAYAGRRGALGRAFTWLRSALDVLFIACRARVRPRGTRAWSRTDGLLRDIRYGLRSLGRSPGFVAFAVGIVGLGIGASVTVFSVVHALLIRPLPFAEPERLVWIANGEWGRGQQLSEISVQVNYLVDIRNESTQITDAAGYHLFDGDGDHTLTVDGRPERVTRLRVTENLFSVLGVEPLHGRFFTADESWDDGPPAIVLTHGFWERAFGADPSIVGRSVTLDDVPVTVVGVLPETFVFTAIFAPSRRIDYVAPFPLSPRSNRTGNTLGLIGRLAPGASVPAAQAELTALAARPTADRRNGFDPVVRPLRDHVSGDFRSTMLVLVGAVGLVMLIVCANLSNLLLARGAGRDREMAIRAAMGAGRRRLIRQVLTESALLAGGGAALGVALAWSGTSLLAGLDLGIPLLSLSRVDQPALLVALAAAVGVALLFGVAPALRGSDVTLHDSLKESGRGASQGRRRGALRNALVVSELALACLLLITSTLMVRSFLHLLDVDLGYSTKNAVALRIDPSTRHASDEERLTYYATVLERLNVAPGVVAAGISDILPMAFNRRWNARTPDRPDDDTVYPYVRVVSDGYVDAMGITLLAGRDLAPTDAPDTPPVALVNEALAKRLWQGDDPLGRVVRSSGRDYRVVGVVRDTRQLSVDQQPGPEIFFPLRQMGRQSQMYLIVSGERSVEDLVSAARTEVGAVDPTVPLDAVLVLKDIVDASIAPRRFLVVLLVGFGAFALVLASLGTYGVISYSVAQRRREIGIHIALGASGSEVCGRVVRESAALTVIGLAIGSSVAAGTGRVLEGLLYVVTPLDPVTYLAVVGILGGVAVAAGYLPARRAGATNPSEVLTADGG
jgi:predicted permease